MLKAGDVTFTIIWVEQNVSTEANITIVPSSTVITTATVTATSSTITTGSFKLLTAHYFIDDVEETNESNVPTWTFSVNGEDLTSNVTTTAGTTYNQIKIKLVNDSSTSYFWDNYLGENLRCTATYTDGTSGYLELLIS